MKFQRLRTCAYTLWQTPARQANKPTANNDRAGAAGQRGKTDMREQLIVFIRDERGLTMVEYAVAGALITLAAVTAFTFLGQMIGLKIGLLALAVLAGGTGL